jgi:hypothetical protein
MNIFGVIDLDTMDIITREYKTINSDSICFFLSDMQSALSHKTNIHLMLDHGPYNKSEQNISKAKELGIKITYYLLIVQISTRLKGFGKTQINM